MSNVHERRRHAAAPPPEASAPVADHGPVVEQERSSRRALRVVGGLIRISIGWVFLWAFLDKTFGFGHETASADAWLRGGEPTTGFLAGATAGPFAGFYQGLAGQSWLDWLFMIGLLGIGVALILGAGVRIAAGAGAVMLVLMWTAVLPPANNLFMDDHLIYALVLVALALGDAGRTLGIGRWWERTALVRRWPALT